MKLAKGLFILIFIFIVTANTDASRLKLNLNTNTDYVGFDFNIKDQPIVDDQVVALTNVHHPGFVAIYNSTNFLLGYSSTMIEVMTHNHSMASLKISKPGVIYAAALCNIHGLWQFGKEIKLA